MSVYTRKGVAPPATLLGALHSRGALVLGPRWAILASCQYYILVNYLCSHYRHINKYHQNTGRRRGRSPPQNELPARAAGFVVLEITYCVIIYDFITVVNNRIRHLVLFIINKFCMYVNDFLIHQYSLL